LKIDITCTGSKLVHIEKLLDFQGALKEINKGEMDKLKHAIVKHGFSFPVFVWGKKILDGHQRIAATKELLGDGYTIGNIPIVEIEADDEATAAEKLLLLNSHYANITTGGLKDFIEATGVDINDIAGDLNIPELDIDAFVDGYVDSDVLSSDDEAPPPPVEPKTKLGDIYRLGEHVLLCADSTRHKNIKKIITNNKPNMVFTDPPYGMNLNCDFSGMKNRLEFAKEKNVKHGKRYKQIIGDTDPFSPIHIFKHLGYVSEIFLWGADYYAENIPNKNDGSWIVWDKRLSDSADRMYGSCFELCWSKAKHKRDIARIKWAGIFGTEKEFDRKRHHPTQKPVDLVVWFLDRWGKKGDIVVDIYGGSGSTLIACEKTDRRCFMMELDPAYCDVIVDRWEKYTGERAILENGENGTEADTNET